MPEPKLGHGMGHDPNDHPHPSEFVQGVTCVLLGRVYQDGETVCWQGAQWTCDQGHWNGPGSAC